jgi:hypothetical protein
VRAVSVALTYIVTSEIFGSKELKVAQVLNALDTPINWVGLTRRQTRMETVPT